MKINTEKLEENLDKLSGYDMLVLEQEERLVGNKTLELSTSKSFQARLAAKALGVNVNDIKALPLRQFNEICIRCFGFLNEPVAETT